MRATDMSHVTAVLLILDLVDDDREDELREAINAHPSNPDLTWIADHMGGTKHPQCLVAGGGCNYLSEEGFIAHLRAIPWATFDVRWVQIAMQGEHNEGMVLRDVYRVADCEPAGWPGCERPEGTA